MDILQCLASEMRGRAESNKKVKGVFSEAEGVGEKVLWEDYRRRMREIHPKGDR